MYNISEKKSLMLENFKRHEAGKEMVRHPSLDLEDCMNSDHPSPLRIRTAPSMESPSIGRAFSTESGGPLSCSTPKFQWSKAKLVVELERKDINGHVLRILAEAAAKFNVVVGQNLLKAFHTTNLEYYNFRKFLKKMFHIDYTDEEFSILCLFYDLNHTGHEIDASQFLKCFIMLRTIYMGEENARIRRRETSYQEKVKEEALKKKKELAERYLIVPDYNYSPEEEIVTLEKFCKAATKYDRKHPSSFGLEAFDVKSLTAGEFREVMKRTFNLALDPKELGVIVKMYGDPETNTIHCSSFVIKFIKIGIEERGKMNSQQLLASRESMEMSKKYYADLVEAANMKLEAGVDCKFFPERDQVSLSVSFSIIHVVESFPEIRYNYVV